MSTKTLPRLFCKPDHDGNVYFKRFDESNGVISLRSLIIEKDLPTVHKWLNAPYARFWQMEGPYSILEQTYTSILNHRHAHSFCGFYNDRLVCLADFYLIGADELSKHLPNDRQQCGIHIIVAPPAEHPIRKMSFHFLNAFLHYYFSFPEAERIYGEPDHRNEKVHLLIKQAGFSLVKQAEMSYKTANIFCIDRMTFFKVQSDHNQQLIQSAHKAINSSSN